MAFGEIYGVGLAVIILYMTLIWLVSLPLKNASIVDSFWGMGFVAAALTYFMLAEGYQPRKTLVVALITIWGLRLSLHIFLRNWGQSEDYRYQKWRADTGSAFWWRSFFRVFMLQGVLLWLISLPLLPAQVSPLPAQFTLLDLLGILVWGVGFFFEAVGDWQLMRFRANPVNKGKLLTSGLWAYTRHPNYFGDAVVWWGCFLIAASTPGGFLTVPCPALMTFLLMNVSGVALLERTLKKSKPGYEDYMASTPAFFPRFPRKRQ